MSLSNLLGSTLLTCLLTISVHSEPEVITLQNEQDISCLLAESSRTSIFYLQPPTTTETTKSNRELLRNMTWQSDDWKTGIPRKSILGPVVDKRWEDFGILSTKLMIFDEKPTSVSFSIYSPFSIKLFVNNANDGSAERFYTDKKYANNWVHYSIVSRNNKVFILENGIIVEKYNDIVPERIVVRTDIKTFWKSHDYKFKYAAEISYQPTLLKIPPSEKTCLIMYSFMCKECSLEITYSENPENKLTILSSDSADFRIYDSWASHKVPLKPNEKNEIMINRKTSTGGEKGNWAIEIRACENEKRITRFKIPTLSTHTCKLLKDTADEESEMVGFPNHQKELDCSPGFIGNNCKIRCIEVLGSSYPKCEKNRICVNSKCTCAWGYQGDSCQESEQPEEKSQPDEKCNPHVRRCEESSPSIRVSSSSSGKVKHSALLLVLVSLVMLVRHTTRSCTGFSQAI